MESAGSGMKCSLCGKSFSGVSYSTVTFSCPVYIITYMGYVSTNTEYAPYIMWKSGNYAINTTFCIWANTISTSYDGTTGTYDNYSFVCYKGNSYTYYFRNDSTNKPYFQTGGYDHYFIGYGW